MRTCCWSDEQTVSCRGVRHCCQQISKGGGDGFVYFAPHFLRRSYASTTGCATRHRPSRGTLVALARLNIVSLGSRGHQSGNNWPGFLYTTQLSGQQNTGVTRTREPRAKWRLLANLKEAVCARRLPAEFGLWQQCGSKRVAASGGSRGEGGTVAITAFPRRTLVEPMTWNADDSKQLLLLTGSLSSGGAAADFSRILMFPYFSQKKENPVKFILNVNLLKGLVGTFLY